jgi:hypothetical protein
LKEVRHLAAADPAIAEILTFIDAERHRSLCLPTISGGLKPPIIYQSIGSIAPIG